MRVDFRPKISLIFPYYLTKSEKFMKRHGYRTRACVVAPASMKLMKSQLESPRSLNSEAITGWVAKTSDESALEVKTPTVSQINLFRNAMSQTGTYQ